jgi:hypothetical protein
LKSEVEKVERALDEEVPFPDLLPFEGHNCAQRGAHKCLFERFTSKHELTKNITTTSVTREVSHFKIDVGENVKAEGRKCERESVGWVRLIPLF